MCEIIARVEADPDILPRTEVTIKIFVTDVALSACPFSNSLACRFYMENCTENISVFQNFGLDYVAFSKMVPDCPLNFLHLAFSCCQVGTTMSTIYLEAFSYLNHF